MNAVTLINGSPLSVKELEGQRVVTFKDIDELHQRPDGTAKDRFSHNRKHFIEGVDFYLVKPSQRYEFHTLETIPNRGLTVFTESGYLMLVKSFNDDLAWAVQRALVNSYFKGKISPPPADALEAWGVIRPVVPAPSDEEIARQFLQSIGAALSSGDYYLIPYYARKHPNTGVLLGTYNDTIITLISSRACEVYARSAGDTRHINKICQDTIAALLRSGLIAERTKEDRKRSVGGACRCSVRLQRKTVNSIGEYKALALLDYQI